MIGAIIGDLAAWTHENDRERFFTHLISDKAIMSEYGITVLSTADALENIPQLDMNTFQKYVHPWYSVDDTECFEVSAEVKIWLNTLHFLHKTEIMGIALMRTIVYSWWRNCGVDSEPFHYDHELDKEELTVHKFLSTIIVSLSMGKSKDETYQLLGNDFKYFRHTINWKEQEGMLCYLLRVWDAFYNAFDFGSALHNAMKMKGNKRLLGALTGAIAEAMYGCSIYFIKKKYLKTEKDSHAMPIDLPTNINKRFSSTLSAIYKQKEWVRVFCPKNDSRTNVERHCYTPIDNPFKDKVISEELKRRIIKSFKPAWEDRYSFYLENGWIYVCRSFVVLCRFRLQKKSDDTYRICCFQTSDEMNDAVNALRNALDSAEFNWGYLESPYKYTSFGFNNMPDEYRNTNKAKFWEGERILHSDGDNIGYWLKEGLESIKAQNNPKLFKHAKSLGQERFGTAYFINVLYAKWCPYDDLNWIFEY